MATVRPYPAPQGATDVNAMLQHDVVPGTRGTVFPAAQYTDGKYHLAWPGLIAAPVEGFNAMWERGDEANIANPDALAASSADSFDAAGGAMTGGLAAGLAGAVPEGAVTANGVSRPLLKEQTWYHGTPTPGFKAFDASMSKSDNFQGPHFSPSPDEASAYAGGSGAVLPVHIRASNPFVWNANDAQASLAKAREIMPDARVAGEIMDPSQMAAFSDALQKAGYDAVDTHVNGRTYERVALQPGTVRSALTGDLLYANSPTGSSVPLAMSAMEQQPFTGRFYRGVAGRNRDFHGPNEGPWASSSPDEAARFAELYGDGGPSGARMYPVDVEFKNPMMVDAQGNDWSSIPYKGQRLSTDDIAAMVPPGHDGLVFQNIIENDGDFGAVGPGNWVPKGTPSTSVKALQPGTVRSATTGNLLYGNAPTGSSVPLAMQAMEKPNVLRGYHGTGHEFSKFADDQTHFFAADPELANNYADDLLAPIPHEEMARAIETGITPEGKYNMPRIQEAQRELRGNYTISGARVIPADIDTSNFQRLSMPGYHWDADEGARLAERMAAARDAGHNGAIIDGMTDASGSRSRQIATWTPNTVTSPLSGNTLYANAPSGSSVPLAVNAMERKGITAYHGSPHDFDKFSLDAIGTGEGAQAYGHGLYFAESESVARSYRDRLAAQYNSPEAARDQLTKATGFSGKTRLQPQMMQGGANGYAVFAVDDPGGLFRKPKERFIGSIQETAPGKFYPHSDGAKVREDGHMYEVNINADPEQFLDWDLPLSKQPENVRGIATKVADEFGLTARLNSPLYAEQPLGNTFAGDVYSDALREAGIPGIRYLDQGSRAAGEGSRNYVVFDDSLVNINRKYANAPTGAASPLAFTDYDEQPRNAMLGY